jgi:hypothetical protein
MTESNQGPSRHLAGLFSFATVTVIPKNLASFDQVEHHVPLNRLPDATSVLANSDVIALTGTDLFDLALWVGQVRQAVGFSNL